jgi:hypothetical protein
LIKRKSTPSPRDLVTEESIILVKPGQRTLRKANAAKVETMHNLLGLLTDDDVDTVFINMVRTMSERLDFRFKGDCVALLNRLERENRE